MDSNTSSPECPPFNFGPTNVAVACLYFLFFPVALLLNGVAAWVSLHLPSNSSFVVYLKNLLAADLLMTLTLPTMAASLLPGASIALRAFDCRYFSVLFYNSLYASITLMGLISLDRYFKIVRPRGQVFGQSVSFSRVMSALVWLVLFGSTVIPTFILTDQKPTNTSGSFCMSLKSPAGVVLHKFVVFFMEILFWLVSILIVFCYICITMTVLKSFRNSGSNNSKGKKKTKLRVFLILLVFFVCFVPLHIMRVPVTINEVFGTDSCTETWVKLAHRFVLWLSTTNACLDPLLYIYLCREFREKLVDMMRAKGICVRFYSKESEGDSE